MEALQSWLMPLVSVLGSISAVAVFYQKFIKPITDKVALIQDLTPIVKNLEKIERLLDRDNRRVARIEDGERVQFKILNDVIQGALTDNNHDQLRKDKDEILDFVLTGIKFED